MCLMAYSEFILYSFYSNVTLHPAAMNFTEGSVGMNTFVPVLYLHDRIKISFTQRLFEKIGGLPRLLHDCRDRVVCMDFHNVGSGLVVLETARVCQAQRKIFSTIILRQQM